MRLLATRRTSAGSKSSCARDPTSDAHPRFGSPSPQPTDGILPPNVRSAPHIASSGDLSGRPYMIFALLLAVGVGLRTRPSPISFSRAGGSRLGVSSMDLLICQTTPALPGKAGGILW